MMNWNWRTHANLSLSYWSNFQVHSATNHVFVYVFLLFLISIHWWFTIMYYFYVYSKYVFMSLTDIPLYLVVCTFGTYLYIVFVYMDVFCFVFCCFYTPTHTAWCFDNNNLFVFPHVTCNVLSVLNKLIVTAYCTILRVHDYCYT